MKYVAAVIVLAFVFNIVFVLATWPMGSIPSLGSHEFARLIFNLKTPVNLLLGVAFLVLLGANVVQNKRPRWVAHPLLVLGMLVSLAIGWNFDANRIFRTLEGPEMAAVDAVTIPLDVPLVSVTYGDVTHAYPLQYLAYHHLVSDRVGDRQLDVTYCVLVDSVRAFVNDPDTSLELIAARSNNSIYRDGETGSWWQQQSGRSVAGERTGTTLETVEAQRLTFSEWRDRYPEGRIMLPVPEFEAFYSRFFPALWPE